MRLTTATPLALLAAACANVGAPPGGPPDEAPPLILSVTPESGSVVTNLDDPAVIQFDEVIEEAAAGGGGMAGVVSGLGRFVVLSPVAGAVDVDWGRSKLRVRPREGWKPGRVYRLELLPGIADLRRNVTEAGRLIVFSTGPALPAAELRGTALAWAEQRPLARGLIHAAPAPDTVGYLTLADSTGGFHLAGIPPGPYVVYAIADQNGNRRRDRREAWDSGLVAIDSTAAATLWAFVHDTVGPRLREAGAIDSLAVRLTFTQALDVTGELAAQQVAVLALPDSTPLAVREVLSASVFDSLMAAARATQDSVKRAAADSARRAAGSRSRRTSTRRSATSAATSARSSRSC